MTQEKEKQSLVFHFQYETMQLGEGDARKDITVTEPVKKGTVLVSLAEEQDEEEIFLIASENCELSAGEDSILAKVNGYPKWEINENNQCVMSVEPIVFISNDKMIAEMTIYPALRGKKLKVEELHSFLQSEKVHFGVDEQELQDAILATRESGKKIVNFVAAKGRPCQNGEDARVKLEIELDSTVGKTQEDGSVDYKERRMFVYVDEGQLIATVVPATPGIPGKNVLGGTVEPKPGQDVTVRVTEDAVFDEKLGVVVAGKGGVVSVVNETNFKVTSKQTISGDIDYNTGNIYAKNNVIITGSVKPGFVVAVRGDIRIGGNVESATVNSHGNLVVAGGVMGEKSQLNIRGDVDLNFVENATVIAAGNIILRKNAYYCAIDAAGDILGGSSSKIVGGRVVCGGNLQVRDIGSESAEHTNIAVGTSSKRLGRYEKIQIQIEELEAKILQIEQRRGKDAKKSLKLIGLEEELSSLQKELRNLNLIHGSPENSLKNEEDSACLAELIVTGEIVAGTRLRIGNMTTKTERSLVGHKFRIDSFLKTIVASPL